jgi:hypothetical protein
MSGGVARVEMKVVNVKGDHRYGYVLVLREDQNSRPQMDQLHSSTLHLGETSAIVYFLVVTMTVMPTGLLRRLGRNVTHDIYA